ncbi:hypothetical protein C0585_06105 [Candidatus Woesearchaeota archaeon]|nr:MAG: hypothetical protein C0585_06105 [Candidatus Woesearchaeota archaeon]
MKFKKEYWMGISIGLIVLFLDFALMRGTRWFIPLVIVAVTSAWIQFWVDFFFENQQKKDYEARFLDFVRNLVGAVKSGMPISKAIIHVAKTSDYGSLNRHIKKLSYQIEWALPVKKALMNFAASTHNDIIKRAISTVIEAEQAGGNIEDVLESITVSLIEIKKIKEQRRASIHSQVLQSYIIFFVFLGVMIVIQNILVPYIGKMQATNIVGGAVGETAEMGLKTVVDIDFTTLSTFILSMMDWFKSLHGIFLMLALIQGLFAGLVIGKLSEGEILGGFKHSIILLTIAFFIMALAQG